MDAGYSGKPLADKLGLKPGMRAWFLTPPSGYLDQFAELDLHLINTLDLPKNDVTEIEFIQFFALWREGMEHKLQFFLKRLARDGIIWVSWRKKSALKQLGIASDLTEDVIREIALPMGLVDVKVCAVDDVWSGLKLVLRKELR